MSINSNKATKASTMDELSGTLQIKKPRGKPGLLSCNCCIMSYNEDYSELGNNTQYICRWRYFCKWFCGLGTIFVLLAVIIIFTAYLPAVAQTSMDNAQLIQIYMSMTNPTKNSITLNSTLQIVNSGQYQATLQSTKATLLYKNKVIGTFIQPDIAISAGTGATFSLATPINITTNSGKELFRNMSGEILKGNAVTIAFSAKPKLKPKVFGIAMPTVSVNMNKNLVIQGALMQNPYIKNITILSTNSTGFVANSELEFSISTPFHLFANNIKVDIYDQYDNQLGYAVIPHLRIIPGYNMLKPIETHFVYCKHCSNSSSYNNISVLHFIQSYLEGGDVNDQIINMRGPKGDLVISNTMNNDAMVYAMCYASDIDSIQMDDEYYYSQN